MRAGRRDGATRITAGASLASWAYETRLGEGAGLSREEGIDGHDRKVTSTGGADWTLGCKKERVGRCTGLRKWAS